MTSCLALARDGCQALFVTKQNGGQEVTEQGPIVSIAQRWMPLSMFCAMVHPQSRPGVRQANGRLDAKHVLNPIKRLVMLLLAFHPSAVFNAAGRGMRSSVISPPFIASCSVALHVTMTSTVDNARFGSTEAGYAEAEELESKYAEAEPLDNDILVVTLTAKCGPKVSRPVCANKEKAYEDAVAMCNARPCIILCRPFVDGNVGAVARGMLNFGLTQLRLVNPIANHTSEEAILRASGARGILRDAVVYDTMAPAVADLQLVFATTARLRENVRVYSPRESIKLAQAALERGERVGFLFGCEKNGLDNEEASHAHALVTIPTNTGFSSLNLAQAVLLCAYEWGAACADAAVDSIDNATVKAKIERMQEERESQRAPLGMLESLFTWWNTTLYDAGFFGGNRPQGQSEKAFTRLRQGWLRSEPTIGEVAVLRGALRAMFEYTDASRHRDSQS